MMMQKAKAFMKKELTLTIASIVAMLSAFFVPPSKAYWGYIDFHVLILLFCLMTVVAGFQWLGVFDWISGKLLSKGRGVKQVVLILVNGVFLSAMLVTNDVALITFVPLTIGLLGKGDKGSLMFAVIMETVAANLGSALTPIGNPQNLYLYGHYNLSLGEFFSIVFPLVLIGYLLTVGVTILLPFDRNQIPPFQGSRQKIRGKLLWIFGGLFALCLLTVGGMIPVMVCGGAVFLLVATFAPFLFKQVDYSLLATFVMFFIFVGNLGEIPQIGRFLVEILQGNELLVSAIVSQFFSNVPTAIMLSNFTQNAEELILGVNIGGLGTMIASLASLISFRLYSGWERAEVGRYFKWFTGINIAMLGFMLLVFQWIG